jgi:hypothetical protein
MSITPGASDCPHCGAVFSAEGVVVDQASRSARDTVIGPRDPAFQSKGILALKVLGGVWVLLICSIALSTAVEFLFPGCEADVKANTAKCGSFSSLMNAWAEWELLGMYAVLFLTVPWLIAALALAYFEHRE